MYTRNALVQRIVRYVVDGTSVSVVGQHWSGRTELLKHVNAALRGIGLATLQLRGIEHARPFEAFRLALPAVPHARRGESEGPADVTRVVAELLGEGPAAVLVDDIDRLDEASWVLLEQMHKSLGTPIIATAEARGGIDPEEKILIRRAEPVVKLTLDELPLDAVHDLLDARLGGQVSPSLSGRIHMKSGGLPGFAVAFADTGRRRGRIHRNGETWHDGTELWSDELEGAFESLIFRYPENVRESLELLVMAGPIPVAQAASLIGQEELEGLEGRGLVRLFRVGASPRVTVNPPGISDYFRHRPETVRSLRLREQLEERLGQEATFGLAEPPVLPRQFADVFAQSEVPFLARAFSDRFDADLVRSWEAWRAEPALRTGIRALELRLTGPADPEEVRAILAETPTDGGSVEERLFFRYLHSRWLVTQEAPLAEIEAALHGDGDLGHPAAIEALILGLHAERDAIGSDALDRIEELAALRGVDGQIAGLILIAMHALGGSSARALEEFERLDDSGWVARFASPLRGLALITAGQPQRALEWASAQLTIARERFDRSAIVADAYIAVMALLTMSRYADATAAGSLVASGRFQAANLPFGPDRALMNALALAARRSGRSGAVATLIDRGEGYRGRSDALPMGAAGFPAAMVTELEGSPEEIGAAYRALAEELRARGYTFSAAGSTILALLVDFDPEAAAAKRDRVAGMGSAVFLAYLDARLAHHAEDPIALVGAARRLQAEHANDSALKYFTAAVRLFREHGREDAAGEVREEIAALMASEDPATPSALSELESSLGFTQREREIIDLVAEGMNNPEIAAELSLSVRTVETHLRNIRRKSGALDRDEIGGFSGNR